MSSSFAAFIQSVVEMAESEKTDGQDPGNPGTPDRTPVPDDVGTADTEPPPSGDPLAEFDAIPDSAIPDSAIPGPRDPAPNPAPGPAPSLAPTPAKLPHSKLITQGICSECAHCGQSLTDAVSIERGIGPVCSRKGYLEEEPKNPDEIQALIELADYPELVDFLTEHYKPQGLRGLMNGLVRVCSLNRRTRVHEVCTNAIEALGYVRLAATLRESLSIAEMKDRGDGTFEVWVKKGHFNWSWSAEAQRIGATKRYGVKGFVIRLYEDAAKTVPTMVTVRNRSVPARAALWKLLNDNFGGYFIKVQGKGAMRIQPPGPKNDD